MAQANDNLETERRQFTLRLPSDLIARIDRAAEQANRSRNAQIEYVLAQWHPGGMVELPADVPFVGHTILTENLRAPITKESSKK